MRLELHARQPGSAFNNSQVTMIVMSANMKLRRPAGSPVSNGFTLVELLVVIAIIGVLIALLLPAVQAAREAARRTQCLNNTKQICLAMQMHHDTFKVLPYGSRGCCEGSWVVWVMPYIEQGALHDLYVYEERYFEEVNDRVTHTSVATYQCPSDEEQITSNFGVLFDGIVKMNYVVNYGNTAWEPDPEKIGGKLAGNEPLETFSFGGETVRFLGAPFYNQGNQHGNARRVSIREITDGTSNTLMVSEVIKGIDFDLRGFAWWGYGNGFTAFYGPNPGELDRMQSLSYCNSSVPNPTCTSSAGGSMIHSVRSQHVGGVNVGMCDSSGRFVSDSVDLEVWRAASTIQGGEPQSLPE